MKIGWLQWWPWRAWRVIGHVDAADDVPQYLPRTGVVVVGPPNSPKWLAFDCPCRRGHRILLPASATVRPRWTFESPRKLTLAPSVDARHGPIRCHYFIAKGRVKWV